MIESEFLAGLLFIVITQIGYLQLKFRYLNHRITAIEETLRSCGIVALPQEKDQEV